MLLNPLPRTAVGRLVAPAESLIMRVGIHRMRSVPEVLRVRSGVGTRASNIADIYVQYFIHIRILNCIDRAESGNNLSPTIEDSVTGHKDIRERLSSEATMALANLGFQGHSSKYVQSAREINTHMRKMPMEEESTNFMNVSLLPGEVAEVVGYDGDKWVCG